MVWMLCVDEGKRKRSSHCCFLHALGALLPRDRMSVPAHPPITVARDFVPNADALRGLFDCL